MVVGGRRERQAGGPPVQGYRVNGSGPRWDRSAVRDGGFQRYSHEYVCNAGGYASAQPARVTAERRRIQYARFWVGFSTVATIAAVFITIIECLT